MKPNRPAQHVARHLALALMLLALVIRATVPQGWMPSKGGSDQAGSFTICSVSGPFRLTLDGNGDPVPADPGERSSHPPCAFATLAALSPPAGSPALLPPAAIAASTVLLRPQTVQHKRVSGPAGARAPPSGTLQA